MRSPSTIYVRIAFVTDEYVTAKTPVIFVYHLLAEVTLALLRFVFHAASTDCLASNCSVSASRDSSSPKAAWKGFDPLARDGPNSSVIIFTDQPGNNCPRWCQAPRLTTYICPRRRPPIKVWCASVIPHCVNRKPYRRQATHGKRFTAARWASSALVALRFIPDSPAALLCDWTPWSARFQITSLLDVAPTGAFLPVRSLPSSLPGR
jgi:hypothetical protein